MIVVDSSALIAILEKEAERDEFFERIARDNVCLCSAVTYQETMLVLFSRHGQNAINDLISFVASQRIQIVPHDHHLAELALDAFKRLGKGRGSRAQLNFCDCAAYALAASMNAPLLYKGGDFVQTDVLPWR